MIHATPPRFGTQMPEDDNDLFPPVASVVDLHHRIICAVCGLPSKIFIGAPGDLCGPCRADPLMTRQHVEQTVEAARARLHTLMSAWEAALAREGEDDQRRWAAVEQARVTIAPAAFRARWMKTLALGDGLSRILEAHEALAQGCAEVERIELWATKALAEIAACEGID